MTSRTRFQSLSATLVAGAVVLALAGCGLLPTASADAGASPAAEAAPASPSPSVAPASPSALASPVGDPEQAVLDFFAAFDRIVITADMDDWNRRWAPGCGYCTRLADAATVYSSLGQGLDPDELADAGYKNFEVTILPGAGTFVVDEAEAIVPIEYVRRIPGETSATSTAEEPVSAMVSLVQEGSTWIVADVTGIPAEAPALTGQAVTEDEAVAALEQYLELERQVYLTGDSSAAEHMARQCESCGPRLQLARDSYAAGMLVDGAASTVELQHRTPTQDLVDTSDLPEAEDSIFVLSTTVHRAEATAVIDGAEQVHPAASYTLDATMLHLHGEWLVIALTESL